MKPLYVAFTVLLCCLSSCREKDIRYGNATVIVYEAVDQKTILPVCAVIDFKNDTGSTRQFVSEQLKLTGASSDSISVDIDTYLAGGCANSLFHYLTPNVHDQTAPQFSVYSDTPIIGSSLVCDTQRVLRILSPEMGRLNLDFKWIPNGTIWRVYPKERMSREENLMGLVALKSDAKSIKITGVKTESRNMEPNRLKRLLNRIKNDDEYKHFIRLDEASKNKIKAGFAQDSTLLVQCIINGHSYYFTGSAYHLANGSLIECE